MCVSLAAVGCLAIYKISVQSNGQFLRYEMQRWIRQEPAPFLRDSRAICTQGRLTARLPLCGTDLGGRQRISIALVTRGFGCVLRGRR